jgi:hypothetical protein
MACFFLFILKALHMKQFQPGEDTRIMIDYSQADIPASARTLQPVVFEEGNAICAVFGPDPQAGVLGCGTTIKEALWDWDKHLQDFKDNYDPDDEVAVYLQEMIDSKTAGPNEASDEPKKTEEEIKEEMPFETPNARGLE